VGITSSGGRGRGAFERSAARMWPMLASPLMKPHRPSMLMAALPSPHRAEPSLGHVPLLLPEPSPKGHRGVTGTPCPRQESVAATTPHRCSGYLAHW
jgi:hypothetical protein